MKPIKKKEEEIKRKKENRSKRNYNFARRDKKAHDAHIMEYKSLSFPRALSHIRAS
jgi:hypothetical protein